MSILTRVERFRDSPNPVPALAAAVFASLSPLLFLPFLSGGTHVEPSSVVLIPAWNFVGYFASCAALFAVGRLTGKNVKFSGILATWGFSYLPAGLFYAVNVAAHLLLPVTGTAGGPLVTIPMFALMLSFLLWKLVLYVAELRLVLRLSVAECLVASLFLVPCAALWYLLSGLLVGLKVPVF